MRYMLAVVSLALSIPAVRAQVPPNTLSSVTATGTASIFVAPDQVMIDVTVTTQSATAQAASSQNATQTNAVISALYMLLGPGANIKTVNYSVSPNFTYPPNGGTPILNGYTASNTVEITLSAVTTAGPVIDTAVQSGATSVSSLRFGLKDPEPSRQQVLKQAAMVAMTHAVAMANGLGKTVGTVISLREGASFQPVVQTTGVAPTATTPIEAGLIQVSATVTLEALMN